MPARRSGSTKATVVMKGERANSASAPKKTRGVDCDGVPRKYTKKEDPVPMCVFHAALAHNSIDAAWDAHLAEPRQCACEHLDK